MTINIFPLYPEPFYVYFTINVSVDLVDLVFSFNTDNDRKYDIRIRIPIR